MIQLVPRDILNHILSYLRPYDLARVAPVSKLWNHVQKTQELWKRHCLTYLDDAKPYQGSWKERFKIIHNWKHGIAEKKTFSSYKNGHVGHIFSILEDNTALEVYYRETFSHYDVYSLYREPRSSYVVRNFSTGKIIPIYNKELCDEKFVASTGQDKIWIVLTKHGKILFFDLLTGQFLKEIKPKNSVEISEAQITCHKQEVITAYNGEIHIWDTDTCSLKQIINVSHLDVVSSLRSTTNFVIFSTYNDTTKTFQIFNIRKDVSCISKMKDLHVEFKIGTACSQSYCAVFVDTQKIYIFEDTGEDLNLIHTLGPFTAPSSKDSSRMCINHNWLLVSNDKELKIYDMKTGTELSSFPHHQKNLWFSSNASRLFTRILKSDSFGREKYHYTLYNFEPLSTHSKKKCTIQ